MNKAEELIACLEGEIAKRDARIVELENLGAEWVNKALAYSAELAAIKAQEPVAWVYPDQLRGLFNTCGSATCAVWNKSAGPRVPLYAAPVSEAKAQGVVMPERKTKADYGVYIDEFADEAAAIYNAALDEVARLNAAPVQQVSVPGECKTCKGTGRRPIGGRGRIFGLTNRCFECQPVTAAEFYGAGDDQ